MHTPFGLPYHDMRTNPLCNFEDKHQDKNNTTEPIQRYSIGSFPFTQLECFNAQSQSTSSHSESATTPARDVLTHSGLERYTYPLIFDTGASQCLTGVKSDFREFFPEGAQHSVIKGIAQGLAIEGEGVVEYTLTCDDGSLVTIRAKSYFVPDLGSRRLISPQGIRSSEGNPCILINPTNDEKDPDSTPEILIMPKHPHWRRQTPERVVVARYHPLTKLPTVQASIGSHHVSHQEALAMSIDVTDTQNVNLSDAQKTLLMLHYRLGHVGFRHIQWMIRTKKLSVRNAKNVEKCDPPKCAACLYAKMSKRPTQSTHFPKPGEDKEMNLKVGDLPYVVIDFTTSSLDDTSLHPLSIIYLDVCFQKISCVVFFVNVPLVFSSLRTYSISKIFPSPWVSSLTKCCLVSICFVLVPLAALLAKRIAPMLST